MLVRNYPTEMLFSGIGCPCSKFNKVWICIVSQMSPQTTKPSKRLTSSPAHTHFCISNLYLKWGVVGKEESHNFAKMSLCSCHRLSTKRQFISLHYHS